MTPTTKHRRGRPQPGAGGVAAVAALACAALLLASASPRAAFASTEHGGAAPPELDEQAAALLAEARSIRGWIVEHRRALHAIPELAFEEVKTSAHIRSALDELGIPYDWPVARTGIVARIGPPPHAVALRADIDALPIAEATGLPFASSHEGRMHACGHDAHAAMLLGAARLLKGLEEAGRLPAGGGGVRLLWQPAEEGRGGAAEVLRAGALEGVGAIFGLHVWPKQGPGGVVSTRPGPMMAASTRFSVSLRGRGGHAAIPHEAVDPVVAAAQVVLALQAIVSREVSPTDSAVVSVTRLNTGPGASNVIPESVELQGSLRALLPSTFDRLRRRVEEVVNATASSAGCAATGWAWSQLPYPPLINDAGLASMVEAVAQRLERASARHQAGGAASSGGGGSGSGIGSSGAANGGLAAAVRFEPLEAPTMAAEDFALYPRAGIPACFSFLTMCGGGRRAGDPRPSDGDGADTTSSTSTASGGGGDCTAPASLHTPRFSADEDQLPTGAALHAAVALEALRRSAEGRLAAPPEPVSAGVLRRDEL